MSREHLREHLSYGQEEHRAQRETMDLSQYAVWAPKPQRVVIQIDGTRAEMARGEDDWWRLARPMRDGERYGFIVDGEGPFPDPRSSFQPAGVHGLSQVVDHRRYEWHDQQWQAPPLAAGVIYELHVGTFTPAGTFAAAIARIPHLVELGVTHVELMPVAAFPGNRGWGYDGVALFAPHHGYGEPDDLKRFIDACHQAGLAVLLDVVYNHLGPSGNYLERFGPYFTTRYATPWGAAVNLDGPGSNEVRRFLCDNALTWIRDYHIDGLRLDAVHALFDMSARHLLEQLSEEVETLEAILGRHLVLIAESDLNDPRIVRSREAGGYGIDAQWSDDFHHALHGIITGERSGYYEDFGTLAQFAQALQHAFVYAGGHSAHRERVHGRATDGLPGWRFVVAAQNHDQIGNRALGERLSHLTSERRTRVAAGLLLSAPFVPLLFQGEEWGATSPFQYFSAHDEPELARAVSEGRRKEFAAFGWDPAGIPDPQALETFERSRLRWDERQAGSHAALFAWYRALIRLRRERPDLRDGNYRDVQVEVDEAAQRLIIRRQQVIIAGNLSPDEAVLALAPPAEGDTPARLLLASDETTRLEGGEVRLASDSMAFLRLPSSAPMPAWRLE